MVLSMDQSNYFLCTEVPDNSYWLDLDINIHSTTIPILTALVPPEVRVETNERLASHPYHNSFQIMILVLSFHTSRILDWTCI